MKGSKTPIEKAEKRGGGEKTAAPFWTACLLLAVASLFLSHYLLGTRDTLINLVPTDASIYIHAQGEQADLALRLLPNLGALEPNESALFAVSDNGSMQWTALLRWRYPFEPTDEERARLTENGAKIIDDRTYAAGATDLVLSDDAQSSSLAQNKLVAPALSSMRGVARAQGYMATTSVEQTASLLVDGLEFAGSPFVFAVTEHKRTNIILVKAEQAPSLLGFRVLATKNQRPLPTLEPAADLNSAISYSFAETDFRLADLLFAEVEAARTALGVPDSTELDEVKNELEDWFTGRLSLTLSAEPTTAGHTRFSLYLPDTEITSLQAVINRLLNVSLPQSITFMRPDKVEETEFIINSEQNSEIKPNFTYPMKQVGSGLILASDQEMLQAGLGSLEAGKAEQKRCAQGADSIINVHNLKFLADYFPILGLIMDYPQFENVVIQRNGDNMVFFCG